MTQQLQQPIAAGPSVSPPVSLTVGVVGLGYVGLPTAIGFASSARVVGVDVDASRRDAIHSLRVDLPEADIARLHDAIDHKLITITDDAELLASVDAIVICVPTPVDGHLTPDLRPLQGL
jgi:UDP-N-acetyl-D-mannosaminuronate dehydrogenase